MAVGDRQRVLDVVADRVWVHPGAVERALCCETRLKHRVGRDARIAEQRLDPVERAVMAAALVVEYDQLPADRQVVVGSQACTIGHQLVGERMGQVELTTVDPRVQQFEEEWHPVGMVGSGDPPGPVEQMRGHARVLPDRLSGGSPQPVESL